MKKGLLINLSIVVALVITIITPFSNKIKAETNVNGGGNIVVGLNVYIYDYEVNTYVKLKEFDINPQDGINGIVTRCIHTTSSGACDIWSGTNINNQVTWDFEGVNFVYDTLYTTRYLYKYEIIFNDFYVGSITFNQTIGDIANIKTYYVNGNSLSFTGSINQAYTSLTITNLDLVKTNQSQSLDNIEDDVEFIKNRTNHIYNIDYL